MAALVAAASLAPGVARADADLTGMWQIRLNKTSEEGYLLKPKLTSAAKAWVDRREVAEKAGYVRNVANMQCLPTGFPSLMQWRSPIMIMQGFGRIAIITEHDPGNDEPRMVYLNRGHPDPVDPSWNGDSVGHWEGDALVVETVGFNGRADAQFAPMTPKTAVKERFTLENQGKTLVDTVTFTDPDIFAQPFTTSWSYDRLPDTAERMEAVCEPDLDALAAVDLKKAQAFDVEAARMLDPALHYNAAGNAVDIKPKP